MGIALALLSWTYVVSIVWVAIVVTSAIMWERSAAFDDVLELADASRFELARVRDNN
ncbi:unannotated protein [freshwater metagenome]|uniref:Unannotated protein n=1 Tax=freshwater metagenome TaxID=449393 RepID=A0A6J6Y3W0_9ZZZZ